MLHQIADREVRGIALPVVAVLLAQLKSRDVRNRQDLATITTTLKDSLDNPLVLPGEAF